MTSRTALNRMYHTKAGRALTALALTALMLALTLLSVQITFYDNDDTNIAFALAGYMTGEPYPAHPFINVLLGRAVSFLYGAFPALPWWLLCQMAALALGAFLTCISLLKAGADGGAPFLAPLIACVGMLTGLYVYAAALVTFTLTAAVIGTAGVTLILSLHPSDTRAGRVWRMLGAGACLGLCLLYRNSSGTVMLCFILGACAYQLLRPCAGDPKPWRRRVAVFSGALMALSLLLMAVNRWGLKTYNAPGFMEFDSARGEYMDYPHDSIVDNPELFAAQGWDSELYVLVNDWFFMDGRVNAASLRALVDGSEHVSPSLKSAAECWRSFYGPRPLVKYLLLILLGAGLAVPAALLGRASPQGEEAVLRRRERVCRGVFAALMMLGSLALCLYLCWTGRLVLRAFQLILFPCVGAVLTLGVPLAGRRPGIAGGVGCALAALVLAFGCYKSLRTVISYDSAAMLADSRALMGYVLEHPDGIYIRDTHVANNVDAVSVYPEAKPVNLLDWGGTGTLTGAKQRQIDALGLGEFTPEVFRQENVYYVGSASSLDRSRFERYLEQQWNAALTAKDIIIGDITVYRVEFEG